MGLVLQNTVDAFLPVAGTVGAGGKQSGAAPADGLFANLLASLSATVDAEGVDLMMDPDALPGATNEDDSEGEMAELLAALFPAAGMPLIKPMATGGEPVGEKGSGREIVGVADGGMPPGAVTGFAADTGATELPSVQTEAPDDVQPGETLSSQAAGMPSPSAVEKPRGDAVGSQVITGATTGTISTQEGAVAAHTPASPKAVVEPETSTEATGELTGVISATGDAASNATGVVRTVGNAEGESTGKDAAESGDDTPGVERPRPHASARSMENAGANSAVGQLRETQATGVDAPAVMEATPAPVEVPQQVDRVATTVIEQVEAGGGEARIHLDPVDLGEVTIHVRTHHDGVEVQIRTERAEAAQLLRDHTQDLSQLLGQRGLNLSDVNVGLGRGNGQGGWGQDGQQQRHTGGEFASILNGGEPAPIERHQRLRATYNPDGAHMYRV